MTEPQERTRLLQDVEESTPPPDPTEVSQTHERGREGTTDALSKKQLWGIYTTHFLSTWNTRSYEFAAARSFPAYCVIACAKRVQ